MTEWYYSSGEVRKGPVGEDELRAMISRGEVRTDHLVWRDGMSDWLPLSKVDELAGTASTPAAPSPRSGGIPVSPYQPPGAEPSPSGANPHLPAPEGSGKATASMVLGICGLVFSCIPCIGLILGILATVYGGQVIDAAKFRSELQPFAGKAKAGQVMGIISIVLAVLMMVLSAFVRVSEGSSP